MRAVAHAYTLVLFVKMTSTVAPRTAECHALAKGARSNGLQTRMWVLTMAYSDREF